MRFSAVPAILFACMAMVGCSSTGPSIEDILAQTSSETTGSIDQTASPPVELVSSSSEELPPEVMALVPPAPVPKAFVPAAGAEGAPVPSARSAAMAVPPQVSVKPTVRHQIFEHSFGDAKPINFGSASPKSLAVHGVDVSRWQGKIDWEKLRRHGANFVYIKATDGGDHLDPMFKENWHGAAQAGLKRGAYHFYYWCRTAAEQAEWFIRNVPKVKGALPPVLDVEWNAFSECKKRPSRTQVLEKMKVFLERLERHYGQRPIIYTAPDFYQDNLVGEFRDYPFWLRSVAAHPSKVYPDREWVFWQYSGTGLSRGVEGKIDLNVFHGGKDEWHQWLTANTG